MQNSNLLWALEENVFSQVIVNQQARVHAWQNCRPSVMECDDGIAFIYIEGILSLAGEYGGSSLDEVREAVGYAAADPGISAIVLKVSSPGGTVPGTMECGDAIYRARAAKPVVAQVTSMAASAAYWLASQCHSIVAGPLDLVGSIGVRMLLYDLSEAFGKEGVRPVHITTGPYKGTGAFGPAVTSQQEMYLQGLVDHTAGAFIEAVAQGRGVPPATVKSWADGRVHPGTSAKQLGLIDGIATETETLAKLAAIEPVRPRQKFDARVEFERCIKSRVDAGERPDRARAAVVRECPDLHQMMLVQANATRPKVLERLARQ